MHQENPGRRGATLIELLMSVSIGAIVISMVVGGMVSINRHMSIQTQRSLAEQEARLLADHLIDKVRMAGGGNAYPYASVWVQNNATGGGSDAVIIASLANFSLQAFGTYPSGGQLVVLSSSGSACVLNNGWLHRHLMVVDRQERFWSTWYIQAVNTVSCSLTVVNSVETGLNYLPSGVVTAGVMVRLAVVELIRLRLDESTEQLLQEEDADNNNTLESTLLADRVVDLQAALGYDISPWNWRVDDTGDTGDEWLYNAFGDALGRTTSQRLGGAKRTDLRMLRISVMVEAPVRGTQITTANRLLDGPVRTRQNQVMGIGTVSVGLRNYNILR